MMKMLSNLLIEFTIYRSYQLKTRKMVAPSLNCFSSIIGAPPQSYADQLVTRLSYLKET
jgi:hypothetical protein